MKKVKVASEITEHRFVATLKDGSEKIIAVGGFTKRSAFLNLYNYCKNTHKGKALVHKSVTIK